MPVYTLSLSGHIKGTENISDDNNASGKMKKGEFSHYALLLLFYYQLTSVAGCSHTKQFTQSWHTRTLDKYFTSKFLFESMRLYSMSF